MEQKYVSKKRIEWLDRAKGLAIILVVYGHALEGTHGSVQFNSYFYNFQHELIYSFHMPLFFLLSGYLMDAWLHRNPRIAIKQKIEGLIIPYFIWSLFQGILMVMMHSKSTVQQGWNTLLLIPVKPIDQFWFIYALFFAFMCVYVMHQILHNRVLILLMSFVLMELSNNVQIWQIRNITLALFYVCVGYWFQNNILIERLHKNSVFVGITVIFISLFF